MLTMTTPNEVKEVIKYLANHKAPGHDNITPQMAKNLPIKWIVFLAGVFNAALHLCYYPKVWKHAIIIPIPKKSAKSPEDLRPISLLFTIGKIYERIILRRLQLYLDNSNFIIPQQFGFRRGHSTTHQLIAVMDYIQIRRSHKEVVGAVFLDFAKAFDKVWHNGLIKKLTKHQFPSDIINFMQNYLQGRTFSVKQGNFITEPKPIQTGVPQGSILGPYLFNIYINDIPLHSKCKLKLFADDTAILFNSKSVNLLKRTRGSQDDSRSPTRSERNLKTPRMDIDEQSPATRVSQQMNAAHPPQDDEENNDNDGPWTTVTNNNQSVIAAGDWNSKHPLWGSRTSNNSGALLHNFSEKENLDIVAPSSPTYYSPLGNPDFLDIAILRNIPWTSRIKTLDALSSDHLPVILELTCPKDEFTTRACRLTNWVHFQQDLISSTPPRVPLKTEANIDSAVTILNDKIYNRYSKNTVISSSSSKQNPSTKALIKEKNKDRKRWQATWDPAHRAIYLNLQGKVNKALKSDSTENWNQFIHKIESSPKDFWRKTKPIRKKTQRISNLVMNGKTLLTDKEIGNELAEHFSNQFSKEKEEDQPNITYNHQQENMLTMTTPNEVIKYLANHKAPGHENITPKMVKNLPIKWIVFLAGDFNAALHLCYYPKVWKHAIIIPIPKISAKSPEDLRPISLLPTIGKIYERIILRRLQRYLDNSNFIIPQQFGFRRGHSTTHQLIAVMDYIQIRRSHKEVVGAVFLDFAKAFDKVWHNGLIKKLTKHQFPSDIINFMQNYLQGRTFSVKQGNFITEPKPIQTGVPQGSILGPYLFNIYINDIPLHSKCKLKLFADDTAILFNSKSVDILAMMISQGSKSAEVAHSSKTVEVSQASNMAKIAWVSQSAEVAHSSKTVEVTQASNMAEIAQSCNTEELVLSSNTPPPSVVAPRSTEAMVALPPDEHIVLETSYTYIPYQLTPNENPAPPPSLLLPNSRGSLLGGRRGGGGAVTTTTKDDRNEEGRKSVQIEARKSKDEGTSPPVQRNDQAISPQ
ncbi:hypothetical protein LAZ67_2002298 [Cordylochernes scorpioides]|uniref:Reverse transcriptase domain-containing protein n=1 Tax=Cordylochernes scorpioides TaxID=51811 RepID=A0ABY6K3M7_9ARAC|nr:hypothetical protein LAZ67_2002298 [Cordylochernes scorpioides]